MIITDPLQPDNPVVFVNGAFTALTGYARHEIVGRNCRFLQGPATDPRDVARIKNAVAERVPIEIELQNHRKDGGAFWNRLLISPVFGDDGELVYFFASQFDVTLEKDRLVRLQRDRDALENEVERRTFDLTQSEDRLRFVLKAGRLGSWSLDLTDLRLVASEECKLSFGREPSDAFTYEDLNAAIYPNDRDRMQDFVRDSIATQSDYEIEYRVVMPTGEIRWVHMRGQPFYRADGTPLSMAGITLDITDRKRAEEHRVLLANELTHRVKNTLATIQSIVNQTLRTASSLEEARETLEARVLSLAAAHDVLTQDAWEGATLEEIVAKALAPFEAGRGSRFRAGGPAIRLPPRISLAFSMALHELATNAVKYGALSNETGHVRLSWTIVDGSMPDHLRFVWEEFDGPTVEPPTRTGFGSRMIERALAQEIDGRAEIEFRPSGVVFTAQAPLPDRQAEAGR